MGTIAWRWMCFQKRDGCFHTTWLTSAVKLRESAPKARKRRYQRPGAESILFANEVKGRWNAAPAAPACRFPI